MLLNGSIKLSNIHITFHTNHFFVCVVRTLKSTLSDFQDFIYTLLFTIVTMCYNRFLEFVPFV